MLQTGDYDFAWNLQVEPAVLDQLQKAAKGSLHCPRHLGRAHRVQFADPNTEVDGQRAEKNTANPIMTDKAVRQRSTWRPARRHF